MFVLATAGFALSKLFVGYGMYSLLLLFDRPMPLIHCLVFGALISLTDPVAVMAIMRELSVSKRLQVEMAGESLFNDGVSIVLFSILVSAVAAPAHSAAGLAKQSIVLLFREGIGGVAAGAILAFFAYLLLKSIDEPNIEVLMSVALVASIVLVSKYLQLSAPLGCAVGGLVIGHRARRHAMREDTRRALDTLWSFIDSLLNALLFFLLGMEALSVGVPGLRHAAVLASIVALVIAARFPSVWLASKVVPRQHIAGRTVVALAWGGLRGGVVLPARSGTHRLPGAAPGSICRARTTHQSPLFTATTISEATPYDDTTR